jgi:hypothetical protein
MSGKWMLFHMRGNRLAENLPETCEIIFFVSFRHPEGWMIAKN